MDDAVVTLLRRTLDVTADEIDERDLPEAWTPGRGSERSPRWRALTLVASAALMAAGVVVVASRGGDPTETGRAGPGVWTARNHLGPRWVSVRGHGPSGPGGAARVRRRIRPRE